MRPYHIRQNWFGELGSRFELELGSRFELELEPTRRGMIAGKSSLSRDQELLYWMIQRQEEEIDTTDDRERLEIANEGAVVVIERF
jgi:hypothetical protein